MRVKLIIVFREYSTGDMEYEEEKARISRDHTILMEPQLKTTITLEDGMVFFIHKLNQNLQTNVVELTQYSDVPYYKNRNNEIEHSLEEYENRGWSIE